jgi:hypothetical protein
VRRPAARTRESKIAEEAEPVEPVEAVTPVESAPATESAATVESAPATVAPTVAATGERGHRCQSLGGQNENEAPHCHVLPHLWNA